MTKGVWGMFVISFLFGVLNGVAIYFNKILARPETAQRATDGATCSSPRE